MIKRCKYSTHQVHTLSGQKDTMIVRHEFFIDPQSMVHDGSVALFDLAGRLINKVELPSRPKGEE